MREHFVQQNRSWITSQYIYFFPQRKLKKTLWGDVNIAEKNGGHDGFINFVFYLEICKLAKKKCLKTQSEFLAVVACSEFHQK